MQKQNTALSSATDQAPALREVTPAVKVYNDVVRLVEAGKLHLPADYSAENNIKQAWLIIQQTVDMNKRPALEVCTPESIVNFLFDMTIQGISLQKKQGYAIVRGNVLCLDRSYFGDKVVAERVQPGLTVFSEVIYEGESIQTSKIMNEYGFITIITAHDQPFPRKENAELIGVYTGGVMKKADGTLVHMGIELMDWTQVENSWKKSKQYNPTSNTFHNQQPDQAWKRTSCRRWCKSIINASSDEVLLAAIRRQDYDSIEAEANDVVDANAGKSETLAISAPVVTPPTGEIPAGGGTVEPVKVDTVQSEQPAEDQQSLIDEAPSQPSNPY